MGIHQIHILLSCSPKQYYLFTIYDSICSNGIWEVNRPLDTYNCKFLVLSRNMTKYKAEHENQLVWSTLIKVAAGHSYVLIWKFDLCLNKWL